MWKESIDLKVRALCLSSHQADSKLREEEKRALRYLETRRDCNSVQAVSVVEEDNVELFFSFPDSCLFFRSRTQNISTQCCTAPLNVTSPGGCLMHVCFIPTAHGVLRQRAGYVVQGDNLSRVSGHDQTKRDWEWVRRGRSHQRPGQLRLAPGNSPDPNRTSLVSKAPRRLSSLVATDWLGSPLWWCTHDAILKEIRLDLPVGARLKSRMCWRLVRIKQDEEIKGCFKMLQTAVW